MSTPLPLTDYACLFAGHPRTPALRTLYEWSGAIEALVRHGRTGAHDAAHHKLAWWTQELQRFATQSAAHPITRALQAYGANTTLANLLAQRLEVAQLELAGVVPDDTNAATGWHWRRHGVLQCSATHLLSPTATADEREQLRLFAAALGEALGHAEACSAPLRQARDGCLLLPLTALAAAGIDEQQLPEALADLRYRDALAAVLRTEIHRGQQAASTALALWRELTPELRAAQRHGAVLLALTAAQLERLAQRPPSRLHEPDSPPPWRTLWQAWREAHRATS